MIDRFYDLAIIGAGPAGMSAAINASELGLHCVVIDDQPSPGGQIYRSAESCPLEDQSILGTEYQEGASIAKRFHSSGVRYLPSTVVWHVDKSGELGVSCSDRSYALKARNILIASGAMERPSPIPGWTLPGVMTAGAAQILLKSSGVIPNGPVVIAGSGPLLFLVANQLLKAGARIIAILDTSPAPQRWKALRYLPKALGASSYLLKGLGLLVGLKKAKIPYYKVASRLHANGESKVESISFVVKGVKRTIACETLLLHQGVVPNVQVTHSLELEHSWDDKQSCWRPKRDEWGCTSCPNIYVAGDGGGIGGANVAAIEGGISVVDIASKQNVITPSKRDELAKPLIKQKRVNLRIRDFLDVLYQPALELRSPSDKTIVCRCEEVTAGQVREMVRLGCLGPNQTKSFSRAGMGPCQGRMCGLTVSEIIADERGVGAEEVGYYRIRPPLKPMTIGELASFERMDDSFD